MRLKDKKKLAIVLATGFVILGVVGVTCGYGIIQISRNNTQEDESLVMTDVGATIASLRAEFAELSTDDMDADMMSEYERLKEQFEAALDDEDITLATQELQSLKELCNSSTETDILVSEVISDNTTTEDTTVEVGGTDNTTSGQATDINTNNTSSNTNNTSSNSGSSNSGSSSNGSSSSGSSSGSSGSSSSGGTTVTHTHSWVEVYKDVYHEEEGNYENVCVKDAWTESIPVYEQRARDVCNGCGKDITDNPTAHMKEQALAGNYACGGYHTEYKQVQVGTNTINHDAIYEKKWVVIKPAWTEKVVSGYKCNCGATK